MAAKSLTEIVAVVVAAALSMALLAVPWLALGLTRAAVLEAAHAAAEA